MVTGQNKSLDLAGVAEVNTDGLCRLTNSDSFEIGHAFYSDSFRFKNSSNANASSFSTAFVFAMVPENSLATVWPLCLLLPRSLYQAKGFHLLNIWVYSTLQSADSAFPHFVTESGQLDYVDLSIGEGRQLWVEYDGPKHQLNVTLSPFNRSKPKPLLSMDIDLSPIILDQMQTLKCSVNNIVPTSKFPLIEVVLCLVIFKAVSVHMLGERQTV
ncbi:hypothetical protein CRYUN_Cryun08bG0157300 [Craigia yunnanensis]